MQAGPRKGRELLTSNRELTTGSEDHPTAVLHGGVFLAGHVDQRGFPTAELHDEDLGGLERLEDLFLRMLEPAGTVTPEERATSLQTGKLSLRLIGPWSSTTLLRWLDEIATPRVPPPAR